MRRTLPRAGLAVLVSLLGGLGGLTGCAAPAFLISTMTVEHRDRGQGVTYRPSTVLHSRDRFFVSVRLAQPAYVYVLQGGVKPARRIWPAADSAPQLLEANRDIDIPTGANEAFLVDGRSPDEYFFVVATPRPLDAAALDRAVDAHLRRTKGSRGIGSKDVDRRSDGDEKRGSLRDGAAVTLISVHVK